MKPICDPYFRPTTSDRRDPLGLIRDAINATYHKADLSGDIAVKRVALTMLAHLAMERKAAGIPEFKNIPGAH